jgi:tetratricopeptide (TPR) repeat protein
MKRVFVVRPFNTKNGIDFEKVHTDLISKALAKAGLEGDTTTAIVEAGNIREDMFRLLVTADIVVADLSIHSANVFYELGIRHGLRPRATVMIRSRVPGHDYPFDLQTDRYIEYDAAEPELQVDALARSLEDTINGSRVDSPVYLLLPDLEPPDPAALKVVPRDFHEEVKRAGDLGRRGDLRLLAHEARGFEWESEGLRVVGRAQFSLEANLGAKETLEWLRQLDVDDIEANQRLATIYQRLGDLSASDIAIQRVLDNRSSTRKDRAEVLALRARNMKSLWRQRFSDNTLSSQQARLKALESPELAQAQQAYAEAFAQDLNAYYPGVNALSLLVLRIELAEAHPDVWNNMFETDAQAIEALATAKERLKYLTGAVNLCLQANRESLERQDKATSEERMWLAITEADFAFLVSARPKYVAQKYRDALTGASVFGVGAALAQLTLFERLEARLPFAKEALEVVRQFAAPKGTDTIQPSHSVLLFTGHRVDAPGRDTPRFPNTAGAESQARQLIRTAIEEERASASGEIIGIAGGACGGDILFHEICAELGIKTLLYLALPPSDFCAASVKDGGPKWVERYNRLVERVPPRVLAENRKLPYWLQRKKDYDIWQRNNLWMLFNALAENPRRFTLIALWNGQQGDGPGGTRDLIQQVGDRGHKTVIRDAGPLKDCV